MTAPTVSVVCINFNGERFLREAVDSVLAQDFEDFELLLVDDGSSDSSPRIARDYAERHPGKVRDLQHPGHANRGASASRNLGIAEARGEFVALLDSDDRWRPHKLREQVGILRAHPTAAMVCGTVNYWHSWDGGSDRLVPTGVIADRPLLPERLLQEIYPFGMADAPCPSDVLIRKFWLDRLGKFVEHFTGPLQLYEDQAMFTRLYLEAPVMFVPNVWLDYRQHPDSCVAWVSKDGLAEKTRRFFLDWFDADLTQRSLQLSPPAARSIARSRRELDHPWLGRARRAWLRLMAGGSKQSAARRPRREPDKRSGF